MDNDEGMRLSDVQIGAEFRCGGSIWRCTDVGTRTIAAIRINPAQLGRRGEDGTISTEHITREEAEADGWLSGPPYALAETVFDEDDLLVCTLCKN